jgi:hypothetical protein
VRTALKYGAGLIAVYLLVYYSTGSGIVLRDSTNGATSLVKAFQGR